MEDKSEQSNEGVTKVVEKCSGDRPFTAETFLVYLRPSHERWQPTTEDCDAANYGLPIGYSWVFRGMDEASWKLIPSLWRERNDKVLKLVQLEQQGDSNAERLKAYQLVYKKLREEFKTCADLLGLLPNCESEAKTQTVSVFDEMTPLDALAQHHGIPTHLLDWTLNPLVAAFFAVENTESTQDCCVYAYNIARMPLQIPVRMDKFRRNPRIELPTAPFSSSTYLRSQMGLFTHMPESSDYFKEHGRWPDLETALKEWKEEYPAHQKLPVLEKIVLNGCERPRLRELLRREFITRSQLMPTLDNVGQEVMAESVRIISSR